MNPNKPLPALSTVGACLLPHLGVVRAAGLDAASFLHNQLTQDVLLLDKHQARLAAFCNAKGRMQASMVVVKNGPDDVLLVMRQDLLAQTLKRLSMFVLRSKVKLTDASADFGVWGVFDTSSDQPWHCRPIIATTKDTADASVSQPSWSVTLYPAAGMSRSLQLLPSAQTPALPDLPLEDWQLGEVLSGIADVQAASFETFVPQMLNYESVDGVNFKKGCYPGQEVVARSQFRGSLKRRTYLTDASAPLDAGQEVFSAADSTQPAGVVAQAAHHSQFGDWALVCLQTSAVEAELHAGEAVLKLHSLPYSLREDI